jgi:hypothetical protein
MGKWTLDADWAYPQICAAMFHKESNEKYQLCNWQKVRRENHFTRLSGGGFKLGR